MRATRRILATPNRHALPLPTILYQNNHVLVVHKPPGWQSVIPGGDRTKCLLRHLQEASMGGGSSRQFLLPVRRLDQPCTGLQLYAKTRRAARRIQGHWKEAVKTYLCVLEDRPSETRDYHDITETRFQQLHGYLQPRRIQGPHGAASGWNVQITAQSTGHGDEKLTELHYRYLNERIVLVKTTQGARHMVRALWAQVAGRPVAGDQRYGALVGLPDRSVALHAYRLQLSHRSQIGKTPCAWTSPPPSSWRKFFPDVDLDDVYDADDDF